MSSAPRSERPFRNAPPSWGPVAMSEHIDRGNGRGWQRWVFPGIWLVYLTQTASGVADHSHGATAVLGYLIILIFSGVYLVTLPWTVSAEPRQFALGLGSMVVMLAIECVLAHQDALAMCVYIGVVCIAGLGRWGFAAVGAIIAVGVVTPALVPAWHSGPDWSFAFTMTAVSLAMYGFFTILQSNRELNAARTEVARLAAENERSRIARDLHDLLGHSLTTITVKAGLAKRLVDRDPARAAQEIGEVEELTRTTLADVRAAVSGYREITLPGELATSYEVLRAAGISAQIPRAVDAVPAAHREVFAWVVREAVTNVVRHSRAQNCTISIGPDWLEIVDDGRGGGDTAGTGLRGVRERVDAVGGTVVAGGGALGGWTLRVELPPVDAGASVSEATGPERTGPELAGPPELAGRP